MRSEEADKNFIEKKQTIKELIKYNGFEFIGTDYQNDFDEIFKDEKILSNKAIGYY
jgi:hypothetical protein